MALARSVVAVTVGLTLLGAGASLYHPVGLALLSHGVRLRGRAMGIHGVAGSVGVALGQGRPLTEILGSMKMVAEGVDTSRSALDLGERQGISMPITVKVNQVLFEGKPPAEGIRELMGRPLRPEAD